MVQTFWSRAETLDRAGLTAWQERRLHALLRYLEDRSPHHRERFREFGLRPDRFRGLGDLRRLPLTTKADLTGDIDPEAGPPFYRRLFLDDVDNVLRWHRTSGTSGTPVRIGDTGWDWQAYSDLSAEALYALGVRRDDTVVIPFGYGPFIAFWVYIGGLERIGAAFVPSGGMDSKGRLDLMREFRVTVLLCTPSYALYLGNTAVEAGLDPRRDTNIRLVVTTGEPRTSTTKAKLTAMWGSEPLDRIGSAETGGIAFECPVCGVYHLHENHLIAEVIDIETEAPVGPGEEGELIVTPLYRRGMPLLRFRTGNRVRRAAQDRYPCGRQFLSLAATENGVVLNRTDALFKVRGVLIDPIAVEKALRAHNECSDNFQIVLTAMRDLDEVTVRVESRRPQAEAESAALVPQLQGSLRSVLGLRVGVEVLPPGSFNLDGNKVKRVLDLRGKGVQHG